MRRLSSYLLVVLTLAGCQQQSPGKASEPVAVPSAPPVAAPVPTGPPPAPLTVPATPVRHRYEQFAATADTVFYAAGRRYYLTLRVQLDTLKPVTYQATSGYQGYYTFTIGDSLRRLVGQRTLRKQDFYQAVGGSLAVASTVHLPTLLGYGAPVGGLVFTVNFGAPETDWVADAVLVLALNGKVRRLVTDYRAGGPAVYAVAPDGRTLLTAEKIFRSRGAPLALARPHMALRGATLLGDSLAVVLYEPGTWRPRPDEGPEGVVTPAQKRRPNAFVLNTHSGQTVARFRYDGFWEELGYTFSSEYLAATRTGYFLDEKQGLYLVSASLPRYVAFRPLKSLTRFVPPVRPGEQRLALAGLNRHFHFYVDTLDASRIRYQYEQVALE